MRQRERDVSQGALERRECPRKGSEAHVEVKELVMLVGDFEGRRLDNLLVQCSADSC